MSTGVAQVGTPKGNKDVEYVWLCDAHVYKGDGAYMQGSVATEAPCNRCGERTGLGVFTADVNDPRLAGWGPVEANAAVGLDLLPRYIWDVNRYYARLGVDPRATKREIRQRYQHVHGETSPTLTSIVKFLLNNDDRWRYDNLSIGRLNFDQEIITSIRVAEARMASEKIARGEGDLAQFQHLFMGVDEDDEEVVDSTLDVSDDDVPARPSGFNWGHYVWRSGCEDFFRLAQWQGALAAVISEQERGISFAVGFMGHADVACDVTVVGYRIVAFLNDKEPVSRHGSAVHWAATRVVQLSKENKVHGKLP